MVVIKRLEDAERDGDRIYAVVRGLGASSDGRAKGLTAPRPEGQALALTRAYEAARVHPSTVGLFEAHGPGRSSAIGPRLRPLAVSSRIMARALGARRSAP